MEAWWGRGKGYGSGLGNGGTTVEDMVETSIGNRWEYGRIID